jgi:hypothetical protein
MKTRLNMGEVQLQNLVVQRYQQFLNCTFACNQKKLD